MAYTVSTGVHVSFHVYIANMLMMCFSYQCSLLEIIKPCQFQLLQRKVSEFGLSIWFYPKKSLDKIFFPPHTHCNNKAHMPKKLLKPNKVLTCLFSSWFLCLLFAAFYDNEFLFQGLEICNGHTSCNAKLWFIFYFSVSVQNDQVRF